MMPTRAHTNGWKAAATALVMLAVLLPASARDAQGSPCNGSRWVFRTLSVEAKWNKKVYRPGEKATIKVTVARPGPEDPAGNGIPMPAPGLLPAEDVTVSTTLMARWPFPWDRAVTNEDGEATLRLKIPSRWKGEIPASTLATRVYNEGGPACSDFEEQGDQYDFLTVRS